MDSSKDQIDKPKKGSLVLELDSGNVSVVEFMLGNKPVVSNGSYQYPLYSGTYILLDTPLLKELL